MPNARDLTGALLSILILTSIPFLVPTRAWAEEPLTLERLREVEAVTESFERHLIDLAGALEDGAGAEALAPFFADRVEHRPAAELAPGPAEALHPAVSRRPWSFPEGSPEVAEAGGAEAAAALAGLLARFASMEDVSLEVTSSTVETPEAGGASIAAEADLAIVARDREGRREWLRGVVSTSGVRPAATDSDEPPPWRITSFVLSDLASLVTPEDLFREVSEAAGVAATDPPLAEGLATMTFWHPHGAAARDVDGDGLLDLFVTGLDGNHLYLNQGDGTFRDRAAPAGLKVLLPDAPELVPAFLDHDGDGDADLFLTARGANLLLENRLVPDGRLSFRDVSAGLPQRPECQGWTPAVGDVNGDGRPDVYVTCYASPLAGPMATTTIDDTAGRPNLLYVAKEDGTFAEAADAWGVADSRFGMGAQFADVDGDADLDLYLANDFGGGNSLFINQGDRFVDRAEELGVAHAAESMGVSFADWDNDGDLDLHVTNMSSKAGMRALERFPEGTHPMEDHLERIWSGNTLYENLGDGRFRDVSAEAGPFPGGWAWGGGFLDIDNDGWEDLHTPNGHLTGAAPYDTESLVFTTIVGATLAEDRETLEAQVTSGFEAQGALIGTGYGFSGNQRDLVLLSLRGQGEERYLDVSGVSGADAAGDGWSSVYADFDNDGDYDVFLRGAHGQAHFLFHNRIGQENRFLRVALEGRESGRDAYGALVRVTVARGEGGPLTLTKVKHGSNGYLAQSDPRLLFGLGPDGEATALEVRWPSGAVQRFEGPFEGSSLRIVEGEEAPESVEERRFRLPDGPGGAVAGTSR